MTTTMQRLADKFDMEIFRLAGRAEVESGSANRNDKKLWLEAARHLRAARLPIRQMMHPKDREDTQ